MHTHTYQSLFDSSDSTAFRCMRLIEKYAPRLMKTGGGSLCQSVKNDLTPPKPKRVSTQAQRDEALRLVREGTLSQHEIAEQAGVYDQLVYRMCLKLGVKLPRCKKVSP